MCSVTSVTLVLLTDDLDLGTGCPCEITSPFPKTVMVIRLARRGRSLNTTLSDSRQLSRNPRSNSVAMSFSVRLGDLGRFPKGDLVRFEGVFLSGARDGVEGVKMAAWVTQNLDEGAVLTEQFMTLH